MPVFSGHLFDAYIFVPFKTKASFLTTEYTEEHGRNHLAPFFRALCVYSVVNQTAVDYDHEKVEVAKQSFDPAIIRYFLQKRRGGVGSFLRFRQNTIALNVENPYSKQKSTGLPFFR
ncbi:MAG: hypothetical protein SWH68_17050 [Thermodesulfobacteriota bacterium]|nr:hypothetical protein [Thermodesulfobacteriota bacterium]